jgi:hypothetical protein
MKMNKIFKFFTRLLKLLLALSISVILVCLIVTQVHNIYLAPTKLISSSASPDLSMKVEFFTQGSLGRSWVNLIILDKLSEKKTEIYSMGGDEVIFPKDLQVFWNEDSSTFLAVSEKTDITHLKSGQNAKLSSGKNLVLMYNAKSRKLLHNLYFPRENNGLYKDDIKQVNWHNCSVCK